jgi:hypothetical protein
MRNFLATVLSVIAAGVMLIAYGLLSPRVGATEAYSPAPPAFANERAGYIEDLTPRRAIAYPVDDIRSNAAYDELRPASRDDLRLSRSNEVFAAQARADRARVAPSRVVRASGRDWKKTAMVIGGSTAAGAGLGAILGGKKGALIGAALGGGAGTLFEVRRD